MLMSELDTATQYHQEMSSKIDSLEQQLKGQAEALHEEIAKREARIVEMRHQIKSRQDRIDELQALVKQAKETEKRQRQELLRRDTQLDRAVQQQTAWTEQHRKDNESTKMALQKAKASLQLAFQNFKTLTEALQKELHERTLVLNDKIHNVQQELAQHASEVNLWKRSMREKQHTIVSLQNKVHGAVIRHNQQDTEKRLIVRQLQERKEQLRTVSQQKEELQQQTLQLHEVEQDTYRNLSFHT